MKKQAKAPELDLAEIAARLMQAQLDETEELNLLKNALEKRAWAELPPSVKKLVAAATAKLEGLLSGEAADAEQALSAAVRLACLATSPAAEPEALEEEPPPPTHPKPTLLPPDPDLDLIGEFLTEANEHVVNAEAALLTLEERPDDAAAVNTVFRAFHTVKGVSSMLGMTALAELAHHAESLLARIRDGQIRCTGVYANLCLRGIDQLKATLNAVAAQLKGQDAKL